MIHHTISYDTPQIPYDLSGPVLFTIFIFQTDSPPHLSDFAYHFAPHAWINVLRQWWFVCVWQFQQFMPKNAIVAHLKLKGSLKLAVLSVGLSLGSGHALTIKHCHAYLPPAPLIAAALLSNVTASLLLSSLLTSSLLLSLLLCCCCCCCITPHCTAFLATRTAACEQVM